MQRFALAIIVTLLTLSASGLSSLVMAEPCTGYEEPGREDGACPPTCVTCACCAQAVEPVVFSATGSPNVRVTEVDGVAPHLPKTRARDILHVPRLRLA